MRACLLCLFLPAAAAAQLTTGPVAPPAVAPAEIAFSPKDVYQSASQAVVAVAAWQGGKAVALGTASLLGGGRALTAARLVLDPATGAPRDSFWVYFKPAAVTGDPAKDLSIARPAKLARYDAATGLALLDLDSPPAGAAALTVADSSATQAGDRVGVVGMPEQGGFWSLTLGTAGPSADDALFTDACVNRGDLGAPLIDARAALLGVCVVAGGRGYALKSAAVAGFVGATPAAAPAPAPAPAAPAAPAGAPHAPSLWTPAHPYRAEVLLGAMRPVATTP